MVMRAMRENTKWIMLILTVAFIGWLVFDWVQGGGGMQGGNNPVVGVVNGEEIRYSEWNQFVQGQLDQARQQVEGSLSDEQTHQVRQRAWDQLVTQRLVRQELERLGLEATEEEIRQAFRTSPPPMLRNHPAFQTDGEFDFQKYRDFFSNPTVDQSLLLQIESYYREEIPRSKLYQRVAQEVVLSDEELWRYYRDRNEAARVRYVSLSAAAEVPDTAVSVTEEEIEGYYRDHREEFERPPVAVVDLVSLTPQPSAEDSARALSQADSLRRVVADGEKSFDELVEEISQDGPGELRAAEIGPIRRDELVGDLREEVFSLPVGEVSEPVLSSSGYHLLRVSSRQGDQAIFSHVLLPVRLSAEGEDALFDRMDRLEEIALRSDLATAADSLGLELRDDLELEEGSEFVPGAGNLGVAVNWAHDPENPVGALSRYFENATGHHILELESRRPGGIRPLDEMREEIRSRLLRQKKERVLRDRLEEAAGELRQGEASLEELAADHGWEVRESDPFTRRDFVPGLGQNTPAVGAAFGLEEGEVAGPLRAGGDRWALVQLTQLLPADRGAFETLKRQLRRQLEQERRQQYLQRWLQALREEAEIQDLRNQLSSVGRAS